MNNRKFKIMLSIGAMSLILIGSVTIIFAYSGSTKTLYGYAELVQATSFINVQENVIRENAPVTIEAHNLLEDTSYRINWTTDNYGKLFIASEKAFDTFLIVVKAPYNASFVTFNLWLESTQELLDSLTMNFIAGEDNGLLQFLDNLPLILVFGIAVFVITAIPLAFIYTSLKRKRT